MFGTMIGNVIGTLYFFVFQLTGFMLAFLLLRKEAFLSKIVLGSVIGAVLLHWLPIIWAFFFDFGYLAHILAALCLVPVWVLYLRRFSGWKVLREELLLGIAKLKAHKVLVVFGFFLFTLWCYLLYTHSIRYDADGSIYTGQCSFGDMNMHLGFITSIAVQRTFPPDYSIFPGVQLAYPFLADSNSSSIYIWGSSLRWAYNLPMVFAFVQVFGCLFLLANTFLKSVGKSTLALIYFFLNGGFGFWYFMNWSKEREFQFTDIFTGYYTTPTNLVSENIRWVNVIADMLLPQRATLFGYAILFAAVYLLYKAVFLNQKDYFFIAAVMGGSLPLIHTHSFLCFGVIAAGYLLMYLYYKNNSGEAVRLSGGAILAVFLCFMIFVQFMLKQDIMPEDRLLPMAVSMIALLVIYGVYQVVLYIKGNGCRTLLFSWGLFLVIVLSLALPQLIGFTFGQVNRGGFVRGCFNWGNQGDFYPWFYIKNMGIVLIFGIAAFAGAGIRTMKFAFPIVPIWFLAEMIAFAPNNYDNNKLLYVAYAFLCIIAADYSVELWKRIKTIKGSGILAGMVLFIATFAGILTLMREAYSEVQLYGKDQVEMAKWIEENTDEEAVFLTSDRHNNIIASMTGRNIVCGSGAFLYFHGIDTSERNADVKAMFEHPAENRGLYQKYHVSYICYSPYEWGNYETEQAEFDRLFPLAFAFENTKIYKASELYKVS